MYIGTDLVQKKGISEKTDKLSFTFETSTNSIPYCGQYGFDVTYSEQDLQDLLMFELDNVISRLNDDSISYQNFSINPITKSIKLWLSVNGVEVVKSFSL